MKRSTWLTDQDVAFAIAQWCSGITQREIAGHFGYKNSAPVCTGIEHFIRKYYPEAPLVPPDRYPLYPEYTGHIDPYFDRKALAKIAFCRFMAQREAA
jgi:hypothetical protein